MVFPPVIENPETHVMCLYVYHFLQLGKNGAAKAFVFPGFSPLCNC